MIDILTIWTKWIDEKCEIDLRSASFLWSRVHDARDLIYNLSKNLLKVFVALRGKRGGVSPSPLPRHPVLLNTHLMMFVLSDVHCEFHSADDDVIRAIVACQSPIGRRTRRRMTVIWREILRRQLLRARHEICRHPHPPNPPLLPFPRGTPL